MIVFGIAATPDAALDGHLLRPGAVDCSHCVPLCHDYGRVIGQVVDLCYAVWAETDDAAALKFGHFSPAGRVIERQRCGDQWHATKFNLTEVSLTARPRNPQCVVLERRNRVAAEQVGRERRYDAELDRLRPASKSEPKLMGIKPEPLNIKPLSLHTGPPPPQTGYAVPAKPKAKRAGWLE